MIIVALAVIGFCISLYGFSIERKLKVNPEYKPMCDISDKASCTKPMLSPLGKLFGISNTLVGMAFYAFVGLLAIMGSYQLLLLVTAAACIISLYLAYLLFFKIKTMCLICIISYIINGTLFGLTLSYVL